MASSLGIVGEADPHETRLDQRLRDRLGEAQHAEPRRHVALEPAQVRRATKAAAVRRE